MREYCCRAYRSHFRKSNRISETVKSLSQAKNYKLSNARDEPTEARLSHVLKPFPKPSLNHEPKKTEANEHSSCIALRDQKENTCPHGTEDESQYRNDSARVTSCRALEVNPKRHGCCARFQAISKAEFKSRAQKTEANEHSSYRALRNPEKKTPVRNGTEYHSSEYN